MANIEWRANRRTGRRPNQRPVHDPAAVMQRCRNDLMTLINRRNDGSTDQDMLRRGLGYISINLNRLRGMVPNEHLQEMIDSCNRLKNSTLRFPVTPGAALLPLTITTNRTGRPKYNITRHILRKYLNMGLSIASIAKSGLCKVSTKTLYRRKKEFNLQNAKGRRIFGEELKHVITLLHNHFPNGGYRTMYDKLRTCGLYATEREVSATLKEIDKLGTATRWARTIRRRTYYVECPNNLLHIDTHLKLIRWNIVVTGGMDGFSRCVTYLNCSNNNNAKTTFYQFMKGVVSFGLPLRIRTDGGTEMNIVEKCFKRLRGEENFLRGRSVHNQRIERFWRDAFEQVLSIHYDTFYEMEQIGMLNIDDELDVTALHMAAIPFLNLKLNFWRRCFNDHRIRTEGYRTPRQLFEIGMRLKATENIKMGRNEEIIDLAKTFVLYMEPSSRLENNCGIPTLPQPPNVKDAIQAISDIAIENLYERFNTAKRFLHQ